MVEYLKEIWFGAVSLVLGMDVTVRRLFQRIVTVQYPREVIKMDPAYRGHIELARRPDMGHDCVACGTCERVCPSNVISVQGVKMHGFDRKELTHYVIDYARCSLCGLCVDSCPQNALKFSMEYQLAGYSRWVSVIDLLGRIQEGK